MRSPDRQCVYVTPCVGVWIETVMDKGTVITEKVTPCVGVWIETIIVIYF